MPVGFAPEMENSPRPLAFAGVLQPTVIAWLLIAVPPSGVTSSAPADPHVKIPPAASARGVGAAVSAASVKAYVPESAVEDGCTTSEPLRMTGSVPKNKSLRSVTTQ